MNVPARENSIQGGLLSAFYKSHNIGNGDCFNVAITGFGRSQYHLNVNLVFIITLIATIYCNV